MNNVISFFVGLVVTHSVVIRSVVVLVRLVLEMDSVSLGSIMISILVSDALGFFLRKMIEGFHRVRHQSPVIVVATVVHLFKFKLN